MQNDVGLNPNNSISQWTHWGQPLDDLTNNGNAITIGGTTFQRGIAMVPGDGNLASIVKYDLTGGDYAKFEGHIGLADEHDHAIGNNANGSCLLGGSVVFSFKVDRQTFFESGRLTGSDNPIKVGFDIPANAKELQIIVNSGGDGNWCDAAVIGDAKLIEAPVISNPSDVNGDGVVNIQDLVLVASHLNTSTPHASVDVNGDGVVNIQDLVMIAQSL